MNPDSCVTVKTLHADVGERGTGGPVSDPDRFAGPAGRDGARSRKTRLLWGGGFRSPGGPSWEPLVFGPGVVKGISMATTLTGPPGGGIKGDASRV